MFIDTHCHLDAYVEASNENLDALFFRLKNSTDNMQQMPKAFIHVACSPADYECAKNISEKYQFVYTAYGIHPEFAKTETFDDEILMQKMLQHSKCIACGEFGLDYHYGINDKVEQLSLFERHLQIGLQSKKPLVLHLREADDDALRILKRVNLNTTKIHVHCFTGAQKFCENLLELSENIYIGFTGIITFKNAQNVRDAASIVPLNKILLETDSPYMAPIPFRGKPSHSGNIPYIAQKLAQIKNIELDELYANCRQNTRECYGI